IYNQLPSEGFVQVRGKSELYQSAMQIVINDIRVIESDQVDLEDFMPKTDKDVAQMFSQIKDMLAAVKNPALKALIAEFLADSELMKEFTAAPAAMQMHHAYLGGLLEHTHSMLAVATQILPLYPKIQADLVLTAVFLHDIAKTKELSYDVAFSYTDAGQLLGHLVLGTQMIKEKAKIIEEQGTPLDQAVLDSLLHIILSHHGQYDFGSPKLPATAEAFMVNYIDNLDAKMNQITNLIENDPGNTDWTAYQRSLETRLYRKKPLE
ncbi:MAG: HD domain-containing protein, partial [Planctomycetes bacterium]|nr:HD domain-containing protein [Planctomycetota bacterium]